MQPELFVYGLLIVTTLIAWRMPVLTGLGALAITAAVSFAFGRIELLGIGWIVAAALAIWGAQRYRGFIRFVLYGVFLVLSLLLLIHQLPGFHNYLVFDKVRFSSDSSPFSMYLNFDKATVGILLLLFYLKGTASMSSKDWRVTGMTLIVLMLALLPIALFIYYIKWDPKLPAGLWLWALNNLFLVCVAEECLFRGFIQGGAERILPKTLLAKWLAVVGTAILFGCAHYKGGVPYIALATAAGIFYGYAYMKTKKIESSILVHFGLNLAHIVFFSYPSLAL